MAWGSVQAWARAWLRTLRMPDGCAPVSRIAGSRDWRLLPVAMLMWAVTLAMQTVSMPCVVDRSVIIWAIGLVVLALTVMMVAVISTGRALNACGGGRRHVGGQLVVMLTAVLVVVVNVGVRQLLDQADPVTLLMGSESQRAVPRQVSITLREPAHASTKRGMDCQARAVVDAVQSDGVMQPSHAAVLAMATYPDCSQWYRGATMRMRVTFTQAAYGRESVWVLASPEPSAGVSSASSTASALQGSVHASWWWRGVNRMQRSLLHATRGLPDQGRVLVPGLAMGVLGHDSPVAVEGQEIVDADYAQWLTQRCKAAGIMHIMAVSGTHFVLVRRLSAFICHRLLAPRWMNAGMAFMLSSGLVMLMQPSASVNRAFVMSWFSTVAMLAGRRAQTGHALSCTMIVMLMADPTAASDLAFALSVGAVLGISWLAPVLQHWWRTWLPRMLADMLAVSVAAQLFALPIQTLMQPALPPWSIIANLVANPLLDVATICALGALMTSWLMPQLGHMLAYAASWGTWPIALAAQWCGDEHAQIDWMPGWQGALMLALVFALMLMWVILAARAGHIVTAMMNNGTSPMRRTLSNRITVWREQTWTELDTVQWKERDHARKTRKRCPPIRRH
ncbi:putative ComEC/Rec2-related domain protein [Bifidobacterium gallicum DSM 20093 = LMG 11596]|nr:putative ComEC/Rec2-related domain protein [Bifidobacterium gallicum DSM 20093 = LMG 11596]